jgi:hypothetical protein
MFAPEPFAQEDADDRLDRSITVIGEVVDQNEFEEDDDPPMEGG